MEAKIFPSKSLTFPSFKTPTSSSPLFRRRHRLLCAAATDDGENKDNINSNEAAPPAPLNVRRLSRRQARQLQEQEKKPPPTPAPPKKKQWEEMTVGEKAVELYVGEKGLLFWLNKFAYASIFIVIGGWILFRFIGPSLGLYKLDTPPLAPSSILKGSP